MIRDLRRYAQQTRTRLFIGMFILVYLIGEGLIYLLFGKNAALVGLFCLLGAFVPISIIVFILAIMDWVVKRTNQN
jgi:hypothetical protein